MNRPIGPRIDPAGRQTLAAGLIGVTVLLAIACTAGPVEAKRADLSQDLITVAWANVAEQARDLILDGADINHQDEAKPSVYLIATSVGYLELLQLTLDRDADIRSLDSFNGTGLVRAAAVDRVVAGSIRQPDQLCVWRFRWSTMPVAPRSLQLCERVGPGSRFADVESLDVGAGTD